MGSIAQLSLLTVSNEIRDVKTSGRRFIIVHVIIQHMGDGLVVCGDASPDLLK
jgi:hypothetical protein